MSLLPPIDCRPRYARLHADEAVWQPAVRVLAERHGIAPTGLRRASGGSHVVYLDDAVVLKLLVPWSAQDVSGAEARMLAHVEGRLPVATPAVLASGELEGWPYLIMTRLPGRPLTELWSRVGRDDRQRLLAQLGELAASLHVLPVPETEARAEWTAEFDARAARLPAKHRDDGLDDRWVAAIEAKVAGLDLAELRDGELAALHMDLQHDHMMVTQRGGRLELTGLYDFGDAMLGAREHELIAPLAFTAPSVDDGPRVFLRAYGYAAAELDEALADRLTGHLLLQRYCSLPYLLAQLSEPTPTDLTGLLARLWTFASSSDP